MKKILLLLFLTSPAMASFNGWTYQRGVTISSTNVVGNLSNFAIVISSFTGVWDSTASVGGHMTNAYDQGFYSDSNCQFALNWDTETVNTTASSATVIWVGLPSLTTSLATAASFYWCYGKSSVTSYIGNASATYDAFTLGVWHLGNGSVLNLGDSTSNRNVATGTNTPTAKAGQIDGGMGLASASTQYAGTANSAAISPPALTWCAWTNFTNLTPAYTAVISKYEGASSSEQFFVKSNGKLAFYYQTIGSGAGNIDGTGTHTLSTGAWNDICVQYNSATGSSMYVNGAVDASGGTAVGTFDSYTAPVFFGHDDDTAGRELNGTMDEIEISSTTRSAAWLGTEYNNQSAPNTFLTIGSEVQSGGANTNGNFFSVFQ